MKTPVPKAFWMGTSLWKLLKMTTGILKKTCGNSRRIRNGCADGDDTCDARKQKLDSFEQRCFDLPYGFDQILCDGKCCPHRRKCVRYMLHVKKRLTATTGAAFYLVCAPKYNFALCFWNYYETKKKK